MSQGLLCASDNIKFWRDKDITNLGCAIPIIAKPSIDQRGKWPGGKAPDWEEIRHHLAASQAAFIEVNRSQNRDSIYIKILTGRYLLSMTRWTNDHFLPRISLNKENGIEFATNKKRTQMAVRGGKIEYGGIHFVSPDEFRTKYETSPIYRSGSYIDKMVAAGGLEEGDNEVDDLLESGFELHENEDQLLRTIEMYIEAEYELEQQAARSNPGYTYLKAVAEPRRSAVKQFFRLTLLQDDYARIRADKPSMLGVVLSDGEEINIEIDNLEASTARCEIIVSTVKQIPAGTFPASSQLKWVALDTLLKIRKEVVGTLREGFASNPWLVPLAAETYNYSKVKPVEVPLPPSEYPPNESQKKAINSGAGTPDYMLVLGPPGTGKTTVISNWVEYFVKQGKRILISSQNNKAVDNVLERVAQNDGLTCVRIGNESKVLSKIHNLLIDNCASDLQKKIVTTIGERTDAVNEAQLVMQELMQVLASDTGLEPTARLIPKLQELADGKLLLLGSFLVGTSDEGIIAGFARLQEELDEYQTLVKRREEQNMASGWTALFSKMAALWTGFRAKRRFNRAVETKNILKPLMETKQQQLTVLVDAMNNWRMTIEDIRQESLYPLLIRLVDVVGATCIGINTNALFKDAPFDVVIIDESGQIQLHNLIVPLARANHAILVGDHKQLPPVVTDEQRDEVKSRAESEMFEVSTELLDKSWFEILWDRSPDDRKVMLNTQFRCPSVISDYISEAFYQGQYFAGEPMKKKQPIFPFFNSTMVFIDTSELELSERCEQSKKQDGRLVVSGNRCETALVLKTLEKVLGVNPDLGLNNEIGVIVPYANHVQEIQRAISKQQKDGKFSELTTPVIELVASVDSYQGQERDLIVFTLTRSNREGAVGFLADWRRLNVAMTRAKKQLVMIGDFSTLSSKPVPGRNDYEFKLAMQQLSRFVKERCQLISASEWNA